MSRQIRPGFVLAALLAPVLLPAVVYFVAAFASGLGPVGSVEALLEQSFGGRPSPVTTGLLGLFPALLLLGGIFLARRLWPQAEWIQAAGWGGLGALLIVLAWANFEVWPLFLPGRSFPGFPHGIELVIGPLIFGPVAILVGAAFLGILAGIRS
ncbi:MAG: hypothetical protein WEG36_03820 [Gemmatimonadota bacterium]